MMIRPNGTLEFIHNKHFNVLSDCASKLFTLNIGFNLFNLVVSYHLSCYESNNIPSIFTYVQVGDYYIMFDFDYRKLTCGLYWQLDELFVPINVRFN